MSQLIEEHRAQNPPSWRDLFRRYRPPTALELATSALEECRREQLNQNQLAEYHTAMGKMLNEREKRLIKDIERLSKRPSAGILDEASK